MFLNTQSSEDNNLKTSLVCTRDCVEDTSQTIWKQRSYVKQKYFFSHCYFLNFLEDTEVAIYFIICQDPFEYTEKTVLLQFFPHEFVRQDKKEWMTMCPKPLTLKGFKDEKLNTSSQPQSRTKPVLALWKEESSRSTILSLYFSEGLRHKHYSGVTE